jgi:hypothetical protein
MATVADLVLRYAPLRRMKPNSKICDDFHAVGLGAQFRFVLWARAQDSVMRFGPKLRILLFAMGHSAGFGCVLWAIVPNHYHSAEPHQFYFESLPNSFQGQ